MTDNEFLVCNKKLTIEMNNLCREIQDCIKNLEDGTIRKTVDLLQGYINVYDEYDRLSVKGEICHEISLLDMFQKAYSSTTRRQPKDKKHSFEVYVEGNLVNKDDFDNVIECYKVRNCFSSFCLLPEILMDNAVKYAIVETPIKIDIHQDSYRKTITLSNIGPCLEEGEEETIFSLDESYRGVNARKTGIPGHGMGLKIASVIIDSHQWRDATISVVPQSKNDVKIINEIPYGWFSVEISIAEPKETDVIPGQNLVNSTIADYLRHEYSRTNPLLEKHSIELYEEVFSSKKCYHQIFINKLRRCVYDLYKLIMDHIVKTIDVIWDNLESDLALANNQKRFDNQLFYFVEKAITFNDGNLVIKKENRGSLSIVPMYSSIFIFHFLLSEFIAGFKEGEMIVRYSTRERFVNPSMEIIAPEGESFNRIPKEKWNILCDIMQKHGVNIERNKETLCIYGTR